VLPVLQCIEGYSAIDSLSSVLQCVAVCYSVLQCCCSALPVLQCIEGYSAIDSLSSVLQCVAVSYSVLQRCCSACVAGVEGCVVMDSLLSVLQCVKVCCSAVPVLQCVQGYAAVRHCFGYECLPGRRDVAMCCRGSSGCCRC